MDLDLADREVPDKADLVDRADPVALADLE